MSDYGDDSSIAAFATAPGKSALTLIRCSGKGSIELLSSVFSPAKIKDAPGNTIIHGWILEEGTINKKVDEVLVSVFRAPKSYTGEDGFDVSCHGGHAAGKAVMAVLKNAGFRGALPGEFTFRAFMNGKIDLTRSESVMELVSAKTEISRRHAVSRLCGSLQKEIGEIKTQLVQVLAGAEIFLDYCEDEISADAEEMEGRLPNRELALVALGRLRKLSASWQFERIYQEGVTLVIAGRPNAGKSSLFNLFLKEDRSIVTEIPGTTRDWIEAFVSIEGIPVRLIDTAGLREAPCAVEKIGVERSRKLLQEADLVLYLIDGESGITAEDEEYTGAIHFDDCSAADLRQNAGQSEKSNFPFLILWNKCDAAPLPQPFPVVNVNPICISAKTGEGLTELYAAITSAILKKDAGINFDEHSSASIGTIRQKNLADAACSRLKEALALAEQNEPLDLIAPLLREAVNSLGEITGEVSTADILEEMFSKFCVGK
ncbi:MAG: tRNA uridine-5-carboxymethylaminomethyl(34) synthesis GTPase MnmE [Treponema sp.]|nr:tRNA uridine-5-carboxymethylaminomethyl(34) synthesis GTPase MnmE [Treponema sp.]